VKKMKKIKLLPLFILILTIITSTQMVFAATITGVVTYEGDVPKLREIKMEADPICLTHNDGSSVYPKVITINEENQMKNVFIYVSQGLPNKKYPTPTEPVILDQKGCMYEPPVFGVMVGQPLKILNPDGTLHNVHALPKKNPEFNLAMPKFRKEVTKKFDIPEMMFQIKCDVHPWMVTLGSVMEHPFFAVTQADGSFKIENLPAGEYTIEALQQRLPSQKLTLNVTAEDKEKEINFKFSRPSK
jgi:plastocyanin